MRSFILIILSSILLLSCSEVKKSPPVIKGLVNLSEWNFGNDGSVNLNGEWEFYWKKLLTSDSFLSKQITPDLYVSFPSTWNGIRIKGEELQGAGYATYRSIIKKPASTNHFGFKVMDGFSCYRMFLNGKEVSSNGIVSSDLKKTVPEFKPRVVEYNTDSSEIEVVIQVANNFSYTGGFWQQIEFGPYLSVKDNWDSVLILCTFILGAIFILFLYHAWVFSLKRNDYAVLWFALICLSVIIRMVITGQRLLYNWFPNIPLGIGYKIEYINISMIVISYTGFFYQMQLRFFRKEIYQFIMFSMAALSVVPLLTNAFFYTSLLLPMLIYISAIAFFLIFSLFSSVSKKRPDISILAVGGIIILVGFFNDILYALQKIHTSFLGVYTFFIFLCFQAFVLARRTATSFNMAEDLSQNLEKKVAERTMELEQERNRTDELLLNILPAATAAELKEKGRANGRTYGMVSVMFIDIVNFTSISEMYVPELLVAELDFCFSAFDEIVQKHKVEKIKTVGDAYLCATGLPTPSYTHAEDILLAAIEIRDFMLDRKIKKELQSEIPFEIRIGVHSGSVVAGIVGLKKYAYDIWGDTVNIAARLQQSCEPGKINISSSTFDLTKAKFECEPRGKIAIKNKQQIDMFFVQYQLRK
jgi:class 3 adenylate cyclase